MFFGEFSHKIDKKGRIAIPSKFRSYLADGVVITRGFEGCLVLYSKKEWQKVLLNLSSLPSNQVESRTFQRIILSGAFDAFLDAQGRILIPEYLRKYAQVSPGNEIMIIGVNNKIEIWAKDRWENYKKNFEKNIEKISQKLPEIGL